jgi:hypothetical protein
VVKYLEYYRPARLINELLSYFLGVGREPVLVSLVVIIPTACHQSCSCCR